MFNFDEQNFRQRWDTAPSAVRQVLQNDLARIDQLLDIDTDFEQWQRHEEKASQQSHLLIEQTYLDMIQNLKLRKQSLLQSVLEKKLAQKRADQVAQSKKLQQDELQQTLQETQTLQQLGIQIQQESDEYADRYNKTPPMLSANETDLSSQIESLRLRLELEAESIIQEMVHEYRQQLRQIAKDEVEYLLSMEDDDVIAEVQDILAENTATAKQADGVVEQDSATESNNQTETVM